MKCSYARPDLRATKCHARSHDRAPSSCPIGQPLAHLASAARPPDTPQLLARPT
ncbi:unnamed protein product [Rhodiola kirilowii]